LIIPRLVDTQVATLIAIDYDGKPQNFGGDPVTVKLIGPLGDIQQERTASNLGQQEENNSSDIMYVIDHKNGQYTIHLRSSVCGRYKRIIIIFKNKLKLINLIFIIMNMFRYRLSVHMLGRPVTFNSNTGHIEFSVIKNIDPICQYNKRPSMQQPAAIAVDPHNARVSKLRNILFVFIRCLLIE